MNQTRYVAPIVENERIAVLDSIRGIAILGILLMNIPGFGLPEPLVNDLSLLKEYNGPNFYVWYIFDGYMEGTQRALFSMLFGASMLLFLMRVQKRTEGLMAADLFFRRQLWLLVFGLFNAFVLLWFWDILFHYAICGMILFTFRNMSPKALLIAAGVCLFIYTARENRSLFAQKIQINRGERVAAIDTTTYKLNDQERAQLETMLDIKKRLSPQAKMEDMQKKLDAVRGSYFSLYREYSNRSMNVETTATYYFLIWDVMLFMFIGMAFFKWGIIQGTAPLKVYTWLAVVGLVVGIPLSAMYVQPEITYNYNEYDVLKNRVADFYEISRLFRSLGFFGLLMLIYRSGWFKRFFEFMRPVGRMAFTNYLLQSFLCGIFFYGIGFGMFGRLQRYELYYVVLAVWLIEIILSHIWLHYFRFGPFEWLWRCLTYWKIQPFKKQRQIIDTSD